MKNFIISPKLLYTIISIIFTQFLIAQNVTVASDNLNSNNSSGGTGWSSNWLTTGSVQFTGGRIFMDGGGSGTARRTVNLTGYNSATLSILWRCEDSSSGFESSDFIRVELSTNGGSSYTTIWNRTGDQICSSDDDEENQSISVSLPVGNANTVIRLRSGTNSDSEAYFWDNIVVTGFTDIDTDGDSVNDSVDDDSDNDGILDINECGNGVQALTVASVQAIPNSGLLSSTLSSTAGGAATFTSSELHYDNYLSAGQGDNFPANSIVFYDSEASDDGDLPGSAIDWTETTVTFDFPIPVTDFQITGFDFDGSGAENVNSLSVQPTSTSANVVNSSGTFESNANNQDIVLDFALASPITQISFNLERPSNGFTIAFTVAFDGCLADTDRDGIFNYLDPDSDGDGCLDVVESGGVDANNNGVLDGTGFAANGRVTGGIGGYNGAGATYNNANRLVITSNPADQTVSTGDPSTTFTVGARVDQATSYAGGNPNYGSAGNANGTRQYQWYDGDPDNGGVALTNSAPYSGVTSATLTVSNPFTTTPKTFYVIVTSSALSTLCTREVRSAQMIPDDPCIPGPGNPDTDGDSVADICDIDDDNDGILDVDETNN